MSYISVSNALDLFLINNIELTDHVDIRKERKRKEKHIKGS
jgi:hypothetical protein